MSDISLISLAFGVVRVVYLATTGRSMVSSTKTLPTSICNDRKSVSVLLFHLLFVLFFFCILIFSGPWFRMNQVAVVLFWPCYLLYSLWSGCDSTKRCSDSFWIWPSSHLDLSWIDSNSAVYLFFLCFNPQGSFLWEDGVALKRTKFCGTALSMDLPSSVIFVWVLLQGTFQGWVQVLLVVIRFLQSGDPIVV